MIINVKMTFLCKNDEFLAPIFWQSGYLHNGILYLKNWGTNVIFITN